MKTVAVFGATGSVGVHTVLQLQNSGYNVIAIGKRENDNGFFEKRGIHYYSVDIKRKETFGVITEQVDVVAHFAGAMPARMEGYNPYEYINSIAIGTLNVLEWMRQKQCGKIIFTQSIADVLYKFGTLEPIEDDAERRFPLNSDHSVYSIFKNASVNLIEHYHVKYGIQRFVLRLPTIYVYHPNPYYFVDGKKRWMGYRLLIDKAMKGETLQIWGNPKSKKEMVYVKDFAQMVKCSADSNCRGGIYNVGCGNPISIEEQIVEIADVFAESKKSSIVYTPDMPDSPQFVLNIEKARRELGYEPQYNFHDLIVDFKKEMLLEPFGELWGYKKDYVK